MKHEHKSSFKKSLKRDAKRGFDIDLLESVIEDLCNGVPLAPKHHDHALTGKYIGFRECHVKPDWLLVYYIEADAIVFCETGTHADLF